jgi:hypothetical protein
MHDVAMTLKRNVIAMINEKFLRGIVSATLLVWAVHVAVFWWTPPFQVDQVLNVIKSREFEGAIGWLLMIAAAALVFFYKNLRAWQLLFIKLYCALFALVGLLAATPDRDSQEAQYGGSVLFAYAFTILLLATIWFFSSKLQKLLRKSKAE